MVAISSVSTGAEKAFKRLVGTFPRDFFQVWDSRHTTERLLSLASKLGCEKLLGSVAKGALADGITLRQLPFEKTLDLLGGVDVTFKVDGKIIGVDITCNPEAYTEKRHKLLSKWDEGRYKLLKGLKYHHVVVVVWKVESWALLSESKKGELAETLLIHLEEQTAFCSELILE